MADGWKNLALFAAVLLIGGGLHILDLAPFAPNILPDLPGFDWIYSWAPHVIAVIIAGACLAPGQSPAQWALIYTVAAAVIEGLPGIAIYFATGGMADTGPALAIVFMTIAFVVIMVAQFLVGWLVLSLMARVRLSRSSMTD